MVRKQVAFSPVVIPDFSSLQNALAPFISKASPLPVHSLTVVPYLGLTQTSLYAHASLPPESRYTIVGADSEEIQNWQRHLCFYLPGLGFMRETRPVVVLQQDTFAANLALGHHKAEWYIRKQGNTFHVQVRYFENYDRNEFYTRMLLVHSLLKTVLEKQGIGCLPVVLDSQRRYEAYFTLKENQLQSMASVGQLFTIFTHDSHGVQTPGLMGWKSLHALLTAPFRDTLPFLHASAIDFTTDMLLLPPARTDSERIERRKLFFHFYREKLGPFLSLKWPSAPEYEDELKKIVREKQFSVIPVWKAITDYVKAAAEQSPFEFQTVVTTLHDILSRFDSMDDIQLRLHLLTEACRDNKNAIICLLLLQLTEGRWPDDRSISAAVTLLDADNSEPALFFKDTVLGKLQLSKISDTVLSSFFSIAGHLHSVFPKEKLDQAVADKLVCGHITEIKHYVVNLIRNPGKEDASASLPFTASLPAWIYNAFSDRMNAFIKAHQESILTAVFEPFYFTSDEKSTVTILGRFSSRTEDLSLLCAQLDFSAEQWDDFIKTVTSSAIKKITG